MGRRKGAVNYKNEVLIKIVGEVLPNGEYGWQIIGYLSLPIIYNGSTYYL
jgi:hypothetical protein